MDISIRAGNFSGWVSQACICFPCLASDVLMVMPSYLSFGSPLFLYYISIPWTQGYSEQTKASSDKVPQYSLLSFLGL